MLEMTSILDKQPLNDIYQERMAKVLNDREVKEFIANYKIPKEVIQRSLTSFNEYIRERDTPSLYIKRKPKLKWFGEYVSVTYEIDHEEKKRMADEIKQEFITDSSTMFNVSYTFADIKKDSFNGAIVQGFQEMVKSYHYKNGAKGVWLCGNYGVGKTFLMGVVARELYNKGASVMFVSSSEFLSNLKRNFDNMSEYQKQMTRAKKAEVLIIDDIGSENTGGWGYSSVLSEILEVRMVSSRLTFFTSNYSFIEFSKLLLEKTNNSHHTGKIMERIRTLSKEVILSGENRREKA